MEDMACRKSQMDENFSSKHWMNFFLKIKNKRIKTLDENWNFLNKNLTHVKF